MDETTMLNQLGPRWGWIALRGIAAIVFALVAAFKVRDHGKRMWSLLAVGALGIVVGVLTFLWPAITALSLLLLIAAWAITTGVFEIVAAIRLRKEIDNEWLLIVSGLASVVFGALLVVWPASGALALIWLIASFAIVLGVLLLALAFKIRNRTHATPAPA